VLVRYGPGSKGMMAAEIQPETGAGGLSSHWSAQPSVFGTGCRQRRRLISLFSFVR